MPSQREVELPLETSKSGTSGTLKLLLPPRVDPESVPAPLLDLRVTGEPRGSLAPVQLLEGEEYLYEFDLDGVRSGRVTTDRPEVFDPDTVEGTRGRLRPGLYTGQLQVHISVGDVRIGRTSFEVRSRKLEYLDEYRWMLRDIADGMSELVMQRFAATEQSFTVDERVGARTLYQRFAFLRSLLEGDVFGGSIEYVIRRPYRTWEDHPEIRRPGQGAPTRSEVVRQMAGPGERVASGVLADQLGIESLPLRIQLNRTIETLDNVPNRFVAFALRRWRDVTGQIRQRLARVTAPSAPEVRGIRECDELLDRLDALLFHEVFRDAGRLTTFPAGNQVLQKREGYRDIYRAYVQFEAAAQLSWEGGEAVYSAGQRDVATLYEYWVYLQLAEHISRLCGEPFSFDNLIEETADGLNVQLIRGRRQILTGRLERLGRELDLELWYNRSFSPNTHLQESWTRVMRPDCSLRIRPARPDPSFFHDEVWLHFDAKYRIEEIEVEAEVEGDEDESEGPAEVVRRSKRADWDRMHAYRDAIYRSSGAYVI